MKTLFGHILLHRRKEMGYMQEHIARALHLLASSAISKWERGDTMPDILLPPFAAGGTDELLGIVGSTERLSMPDSIRLTSFIRN